MRFPRILHVLETQDFYIFNNFPARIYILVNLETNFASVFQKKKKIVNLNFLLYLIDLDYVCKYNMAGKIFVWVWHLNSQARDSASPIFF